MDAGQPISTTSVNSAEPRNIVICCDGTSNDVTCDTTNVLRIFRCLTKNSSQIAYYDAGVGTVADPRQLTSLGKFLSRKLDMAIGHGVRENVCMAYRFLCRTYQPGDRIYLFGFSRGAYTIRALAGIINSLGLPRPELEDLDRLGWAVYADDGLGLPTSKRFAAGGRYKKAFARSEDVRIHFVGAWDTVSSVGWIWDPLMLPYTANNSQINHVRHAVSIDEHRAAFQANLFHPNPILQHASFKEVWFAGSHGDVGGGYPEKDNGLAKIALEWMLREAAEQCCQFDQAAINEVLGLKGGGKSKPDAKATAHNSTAGLWNLLEYVPRKQWDAAIKNMRWYLPNWYRSRQIPENAFLHSSVKEKMAVDSHYRPTNLPTVYSIET